MSNLNQEFLRTLKEKLNIAEVAQSYFTLEKRGDNYWACCPFHHEKTASFAINETRQFYHCFGCGASGDVIKLVSEMETLDFVATVKLLAEKAGVPLPQDDFDDGQSAELKRKRDAVLKILNDTAHFYLNNLNSGKADEHIEYILKREIPSKMVRTFGMGASLNYSDLPAYLLSKGYSRRDIVDSGVVNEVEGRLSDAMGGRLIIPIINSYDEVIAFGGRMMKPTAMRKYVNTRDTIAFTKRKNLYNINLLKRLKREQTIKEVIMVEGYMDVISLYSAGFKNVVASMGTSLTQEQARLIKRYTDTVLISYDGDSAGQKANLRGLDILKDEGLNVRVVPLPTGLDPDDVIKKQGQDGYRACLDAAMPLIDYKLTVLQRGYDLSRTEDKRKFVSEALKIIRTADSEAEREELLKQLRTKTGISFEALRRDLDSERVEVNQPKAEPVKRADDADAIKKASRFVIAAYLFGKTYTEDFPIESVEFIDDVHTILAKFVSSKRLLGDTVKISEIFDFFDENTPEYGEMERVLDYVDGGGFSGDVEEKYFKDCVLRLKLHSLDRQIEGLKSAVKEVSDTAESAKIVQRIYELAKQKEKLKNGVL